MKNTKIQHRITSLERWGMQVHADFQPDSAAHVKQAGFTGVLVNGGSGIGPDMLTIESLVASEIIPDLMPLTVEGNRREMIRRCSVLEEAGLKPWLCLWGVPGPDDSDGSHAAASNRFFDRRTKLEMHAKLARTPELFGQRNPGTLSWRGSRPLCVSHPTVRAYYRDLMAKLVESYSELEGIFFFPGDNEPEICSDLCPRCKETGLDQIDLLIRHVNDMYQAVTAIKPDFKLYFTVWNQQSAGQIANIHRYMDGLNPGIGICMSISDNKAQERKSGTMVFNQPWVNFTEPGGQFLETSAIAARQGRNVMVLGEISQAEVWDPVCHNIPNPKKVLDLLRNCEGVEAVDALCDFWGHRRPFISHANHAAMRTYYDDPNADQDVMLERSAKIHYGLGEQQSELLSEALDCWQKFDATVDDWALNIWCQRFSFCIGRDGARGFLYRALIPANLMDLRNSWAMRLLKGNHTDPVSFGHFQQQDRLAFIEVSAAYGRLASSLEVAGLASSADLALREATNIELAGELLASVGRTFLAADAYQEGDSETLRSIILEEIDARLRQLEISGRIGWGAGVNPILISEDIQNMRLYLSHDDFPNVPDSLFQFTETPYSV